MADYKISFLNISQTESVILENHYAVMDESRKAETDALPSEQKKMQKIAADMLCRKMISEKCGIPEKEIIFSKNVFGKPYAENTDVFFSISHSDDYVVCAVSDNETGIDIEKIRDVRLKAAERFCTDSEIEYIGNSSERLVRIWTLKESFFKCKGTGLGADVKSVSFDFDGDKIICSESGYELTCDNIVDGYICSVCIRK